MSVLFYAHNIGMGYVEYNKNPCGKHTDDCTVRALSTLLDEDWDGVYLELCLIGLSMCEMPSQKAVVHEFLKRRGYVRHIIPNGMPSVYSVKDFAEDHPNGTYLLTTDSHMLPVIQGSYIDNWNSGNEIPLFYWEREKGDIYAV